MVEWLTDRECWPADTTCSAAARGGHLNVLNVIRTLLDVCDWRMFDENTCSGAAKGGHLVVLKWLRANGCPWEWMTCAHAAKEGYLEEVLKWARANGCDCDEATCQYAALGGQLEVLKWAVANGRPWSPGVCMESAYNHYQFAVMAWIKQKVGYDSMYTEFSSGSDEY